MNRFSSIFSQLLQLFSRTESQHLVTVTQAERHSKGFTCWGQFVAMLFCQLGRAHTLRQITGGLRSCEGKLKHLGITAPSHFTLAYVNERRPWELYEQVFFQLFERCRTQVVGKEMFRFKNKLISMDSTTIDLCLEMFDWAKSRRTKEAIKLHLLLDHDGYFPCFAVVTEGNVSDVKVARQFHFDPGTIVVDDRGYNDYALFGYWTAQDIYFVTRMKDNALYEVIGEKKVLQHRNVLKDEMIELRGPRAIEKCPYPLRRIEVYDPETQEVLVFLTNHMNLGATTIAAICKERWRIETLFKSLKQNLKIKTFVGTSANAVKIQIWTALIAMLILRFLQLRSKFNWSLSNLVALLRMNLFTHRDLWAWFNEPFEVAPVPYAPEQLQFCLR
jgi:hypothetical protein